MNIEEMLNEADSDYWKKVYNYDGDVKCGSEEGEEVCSKNMSKNPIYPFKCLEFDCLNSSFVLYCLCEHQEII